MFEMVKNIELDWGNLKNAVGVVGGLLGFMIYWLVAIVVAGNGSILGPVMLVVGILAAGYFGYINDGLGPAFKRQAKSSND